jgi:hypothetical protein
MTDGRTVNRWVRAYMAGYDMSGYSRTIGPLLWEYDMSDVTAIMSDAMMGYLPVRANISPGVLNGLFDNTATSGLHVVASSIQQSQVAMFPIGIRAAPASGDPVFMGQFVQLGYNAETNDLTSYANVPFGMWDVANEIAYDQPWGNLVHAKGAETGANSGTNDVDGGGATTAGGWLMYHVFAGDGTATISIDDAATDSDPSYSALSGATTGSINCAVVQKGIVALGVTATVRQYLRWQIVLGTATTVTFAMAFVRGR